MQITDLAYLDNILENDESILGAYGVSVTSQALASGSSPSFAYATSSSATQTSSSGVSTSRGAGLAAAIGDFTANLTVVNQPNTVTKKPKFKPFSTTSVINSLPVFRINF